MSSQAAVSGQPKRNNGATVKKGGKIDSANTVTSVRSEMDDAIFDGYGSKVTLAVSPTESGTLGTFKALSGGTFSYQMAAGKYVAKILGDEINGTASTFLRSGAADVGGRRNPAAKTHYHRLDETSWDYVTGAVTKGTNAGDSTSYKNIDSGSVIDQGAYPTNAIPGELVYRTGAKVPVQDDYKPRTNP